jgi:amidase
MGFVSWVNTFEGKTGTGKKMVLDSELVKEFHSLGAIPLGKVRFYF